MYQGIYVGILSHLISYVCHQHYMYIPSSNGIQRLLVTSGGPSGTTDAAGSPHFHFQCPFRHSPTDLALNRKTD